MNTTFYKQSLPVIVLAVVAAVLLGFNYMSAQTWVAPTGTAPSNNATAPVNVGPTTQAKTGGLAATILAATTEVRSDRYCDALGANCTSMSGGTWGSWTNVTASRPTGVWHQNTSGKGIMVHFYVGRPDVIAFVSPTGSNANQIQITGVDGDSGERTHGHFLVPPGNYYRFNGGTMSMVAELELPF